MRKIDFVNYRYAIIIDGYVYKDYASIEELKRGIDRFYQRRYKPVPFRLAKLQITTVEVENINL
jgi:hypothetical protein